MLIMDGIVLFPTNVVKNYPSFGAYPKHFSVGCLFPPIYGPRKGMFECSFRGSCSHKFPGTNNCAIAEPQIALRLMCRQKNRDSL